MNFGEVLSRAWQIIWRFKVLWIFGILASCASGGGGGGGGGGGDNGFDFNGGQTPTFPQIDPAAITLIVIAAVVLILLLSIIFLVLGTVGRIGLVRGAWRADEGAAAMSFGQLWSESLPYFWRVIGLLALVLLVSLLLFFVAALPFLGGLAALFAAGDSAVGPGMFLTGLPIFICLLCLLVPISWVISLVVQQAVVAIVGENVGIGEGVRRGWAVVRSNLANIIVMAIILFGARFLLGLVLALPFLALLVPIVMGFAFNDGRASGIGFGVAALLFLLLLPIVIVVNGIIETYIGTAWTLTYRRLTGRTAGSPTPAAVPEAPIA